MSFIDELCDYLVGKQLIPSERVIELQSTIRQSAVDLEVLEAINHPDSVPWGMAPWDIPPYNESKYPSMKDWMASWTLKKETVKELEEDVQTSRNGRHGGTRGNSANRKAIKAPELNDLLPTIILKDKLLATLLPALATGKWNGNPTWKKWCDAVDLLLPLDATALDTKLRRLLGSPNPQAAACLFDFIYFFDRQSFLPPNVLDGYSGQSVSAFKALMADNQKTVFDFTKHNWIFTNRNLLVTYQALFILNRLRPLLMAYVKSTYPDDKDYDGDSMAAAHKEFCEAFSITKQKETAPIPALISRSERLCRLFARTHEREAEALLRKWLSSWKDSFKYVVEACIFFEETEISPNLEDPKTGETILFRCPDEIMPRLAKCGADLNHTNSLGNTLLQKKLDTISKEYYLNDNKLSHEFYGKEIETLISLGGIPPKMIDEDWKLIHLAGWDLNPGLANYVAMRTVFIHLSQYVNKLGQTPLHLITATHAKTALGRFFEELKRPFFRGDPYFDNFNSPEFNKLINYKDRFGRTALHVHCHPPNPTLVDLLIENGAEVNALDEDGNTPLHKAFLACQQEEYFTEAFSIIKSLLNAKADISIKNNEGKTPLELDDIVSDVLTQLLEHPDS